MWIAVAFLCGLFLGGALDFFLHRLAEMERELEETD